MANGTSGKRTLNCDDERVNHVSKRVKTADASTADRSSHPSMEDGKGITEKKPNRLQRAISKKVTSKRKSAITISLAKKIKKAEKEKGILAAVLEAPVELFEEISLYLSPGDLLSLSRVSRAIRDFYLSKSRKKVWTVSLASAGLPGCPEDLTESQYASLIYDTDCIACNTPHIQTVDCDLRLRMCRKCLELNTDDGCIIFYEFQQSLKVGDLTKGEIKEVVNTACQYTPHMHWFQGSREIVYYRPDLLDAYAECLLQYRTKSRREYDVFVKEKMRLKEKIDKHALELKSWMEERDIKNDQKRDELIKRHASSSVKSKLIELGYNKDDWASFDDTPYMYICAKEWYKMVYQGRELTAKTWKNLQPKLEVYLTERRQRRTERRRTVEFETFYLKYCSDLNMTFGENGFLMSAKNMLKEQSIIDFAFHDNFQREITDELWSDFLPTLKQILIDSKFKALAEHDQLIIEKRSAKETGAYNLEPLEHALLASSFFEGRRINKIFDDRKPYFFISMHAIGTMGMSLKAPNTPWVDSCDDREVIDFTIPDALLADLSLSPTTTMAAMHCYGNRFVCLRCDDVLKKAMSWPELVSHYMEETAWDTSVIREIERLQLGIQYYNVHEPKGGNMARIFDETEDIPVPEAHKPSSHRKYGCNICNGRIFGRPAMGSRLKIEAHIRMKHGMEPRSCDVNKLHTNTF